MKRTARRKAVKTSGQSLQRQRAKVLEEVRKYVELQDRPDFRPGRDRVHYAGRVFTAAEVQAMVSASLDSWVTLGPYGKKLEAALAQFLGLKHVILVNSGSSANLLAVAALCSPQLAEGLRPGDEVITPAVTFPTTLAPLLQYQLVPVFVDSCLGDYNLDVSRLEGALSERTRAIMIPHTLGNPCQMDKIAELAQRRRLFLVEDNCDALGSRYQNRLTGTFGTLSTYSFYPAHHMTMGEGGAIATNDPKMARLLRSLRDWGRDCYCEADAAPAGTCNNRLNFKIAGLSESYDHRYVYANRGYNLKPTDLQAALGLAQIKKLPGFIRARRRNFRTLGRGLARYARWLILPQATPHSEPSWFAFPITVRPEAGFTRRELVGFLEEHNIETRLLFAGNITRQPAYRDAPGRVSGELVNADLVMTNTFFLGVYPGLRPEHLRYIFRMFAEFFKGEV